MTIDDAELSAKHVIAASGRYLRSITLVRALRNTRNVVAGKECPWGRRRDFAERELADAITAQGVAERVLREAIRLHRHFESGCAGAEWPTSYDEARNGEGR